MRQEYSHNANTKYFIQKICGIKSGFSDLCVDSATRLQNTRPIAELKTWKGLAARPWAFSLKEAQPVLPPIDRDTNNMERELR